MQFSTDLFTNLCDLLIEVEFFVNSFPQEFDRVAAINDLTLKN